MYNVFTKVIELELPKEGRTDGKKEGRKREKEGGKKAGRKEEKKGKTGIRKNKKSEKYYIYERN